MRKGIVIICKMCGVEMERTGSRQHYCISCREKMREVWRKNWLSENRERNNENGKRRSKERNAVNPAMCVCPICGKLGKKTGNQKHCSPECRKVTKAIRQSAKYVPKRGRNGSLIHCDLCGKETTLVTGNTLYCEDCSRIMMSYYIRRRDLRKRGAGGTHTKKEFNELCARVGWQCEYCGKPLNMKTVTEDHIVAIASGGDDSILNIAVACRSCNSSKQTKPADVFLDLLEKKRAVI